MVDIGCFIDWGQGSFVIRLPDPAGGGVNFTLFVVATNGLMYTGWPVEQFRRLGLDEQIRRDFIARSAQLLGRRVKPKDPSAWDRSVSLQDLELHYEEFLSLLKEVVEKIREASNEAGGA